MDEQQKAGAYAFAHKKAEECLDTYTYWAHKQIEMEKIVVLLNKIKNSGSRVAITSSTTNNKDMEDIHEKLIGKFHALFLFFQKWAQYMIRVLTASIIDKWRRS